MTPATDASRPPARPRTLAVLGLLLIGGVLPVSSATAATTQESLVSVRSAKVGSTQAPVTVTVRTRAAAVVRVTVNGHAVPGAFGRAGTTTRVAHLSLRNGLRAGGNRLVVTATRAGGVRDVDVRTVRVAAARLLADAGQDRTLVAGRSVRVGHGAPTAVRGATPEHYRWRIVRAPKGARAALRGSGRARAVLTPRVRGTYRLRLTTTTRAGAVAHDSVDLFATPDDPPTGVRIQTLAGGTGGQIRIDGRDMPNTGANDGGIYIAVVERRTRAVPEQGTAPRNVDGVNQVREIASSWGKKGDYLVVLSGSNGIASGDLDGIDRFLAVVGGAKLSASDRAKLADGSPFSIIGDTNAPAGSAWVSIAAKRPGVSVARTRAAANLSGSLVRSDVSGRYDYVEDDVPHFQTHVADPGLPDNREMNRMSIAGQPHDAWLPAGHATGFDIIALDPQNLDMLSEKALPVDATDLAGRGEQARALADALQAAASFPGQPIVLVQSIGNPVAGTPEWAKASAWIEKLGGDPRQFNAMDGTKGYALVGGLGSPQTAVEASTVAGTGRELTGLFGRSRATGFGPMAGDAAGTADNGLADIVHQTSKPFPEWDTPGKRAAATWIARKVGVCDDGCDIRRQYWEQYRANWDGRYNTLATLKQDVTSDQESLPAAVTKAEFNAVAGQLLTEFTALSDSRGYFDELTKPFGLADTQALIDVQGVGKALYDSVQPPPANNTTSYWLNFTGKVLAVVGGVASVFPPAGAAITGLAAGFSLVGYLTQQDGKPVGGDILTRADAFQQTVLDRLRVAQSNLQFMAVQIASDWGKLQAVRQKIVSRQWRIDATDARAVRLLRAALQQWIAQTFVPQVYTDLRYAIGIFDRPFPEPTRKPTDDIRQFECRDAQARGFPYRDVPLNAQVPATVGFNADGTAIRGTYIVTHERGGALPSALATLLYNAPDAATPGMGIDPWTLNSPRNFARIVGMDDRHCGF